MVTFVYMIMLATSWKMKKLIIIILTIISSSSFSQEVGCIFHFNDFIIIKEKNSKKYKILNSENKTIIKDLKYVNYAGDSNSLQVLDKNNNLIYLDSNLKRINTPKEVIITVCGTLVYYKRKIIEDNRNYYIEFIEDKSLYSEGVKKSIVDTIPKIGIKKIYFANSSKEIFYDGYSDFPTYLILDLGDKFGIKQGDLIQYFDYVDLKNPFAIKVKKKDYFGYYGITDIKYKKLGDFEYNLASFTDKKGNIGYIDLNGNEY